MSQGITLPLPVCFKQILESSAPLGTVTANSNFQASSRVDCCPDASVLVGCLLCTSGSCERGDAGANLCPSPGIAELINPALPQGPRVLHTTWIFISFWRAGMMQIPLHGDRHRVFAVPPCDTPVPDCPHGSQQHFSALLPNFLISLSLPPCLFSFSALLGSCHGNCDDSIQVLPFHIIFPSHIPRIFSSTGSCRGGRVCLSCPAGTDSWSSSKRGNSPSKTRN